MKRSQKFIKAANSLLALFVLVSLTLSLFVAFLRATGSEVHIGGINLFRIVSGSMSPAYNPGDYVVTIRTAAEKLKVGDIIAFVPRGGGADEVIVHRIYEIGEDRSFITRGDANPVDDLHRVGAGQIVGRVAFDLPLFGLVDRMLRGTGGFLLLIALPVLAMIIIETCGIFAALSRRRSLRRMISAYRLDPADEELCSLVEKYGEDALRQIVMSGDTTRSENRDKEDAFDE